MVNGLSVLRLQTSYQGLCFSHRCGAEMQTRMDEWTWLSGCYSRLALRHIVETTGAIIVACLQRVHTRLHLFLLSATDKIKSTMIMIVLII